MKDNMFLEMSETPGVVGEIVRRQATLSGCVDFLLAGLEKRNLLFTGCGSSYFAGITGAYACGSLLRKASAVISAFDYSRYRWAGTPLHAFFLRPYWALEVCLDDSLLTPCRQRPPVILAMAPPESCELKCMSQGG